MTYLLTCNIHLYTFRLVMVVNIKLRCCKIFGDIQQHNLCEKALVIQRKERGCVSDIYIHEGQQNVEGWRTSDHLTPLTGLTFPFRLTSMSTQKSQKNVFSSLSSSVVSFFTKNIYILISKKNNNNNLSSMLELYFFRFI